MGNLSDKAAACVPLTALSEPPVLFLPASSPSFRRISTETAMVCYYVRIDRNLNRFVLNEFFEFSDMYIAVAYLWRALAGVAARQDLV